MKDNVRGVIAVVDMRSTCLCAVDTVIRIEDKDIDVYSCSGCVFRDKLDTVLCPYRIMNTRGRRVLL
jgi:hypothetical protein